MARGVRHRDLPIEQRVIAGQCGKRGHQGAEPIGPVEAVARADDDLAACDRRDGPVAVVLDLVQPVVTGGGLVDERCELRAYERREPAAGVFF